MEGYGNENPGAFQPTRPLRGATKRIAEPIHNSSISTHAPLAGRDLEWHLSPQDTLISTHAPLAGRDWDEQTVKRLMVISTHAPLAGRDFFRD